MLRATTLVLIALVGSLVGISRDAARAQTPAAADITLSAVALNVSDLAQSEKFYIDLLGLERTFRYPADGKLLEVGLSRPGQKGQMSVILAHFNDDPLPEGKERYGRIVVVTHRCEGGGQAGERCGIRGEDLERAAGRLGRSSSSPIPTAIRSSSISPRRSRRRPAVSDESGGLIRRRAGRCRPILRSAAPAARCEVSSGTSNPARGTAGSAIATTASRSRTSSDGPTPSSTSAGERPSSRSRPGASRSRREPSTSPACV